MKVAIVHDYLNQLGGAEKVVGTLHEIFPDAPIYTLFVDQSRLWPELHDAKIITSFLQKIPFIRSHFKLFFWLYPFVIHSMKVDGYDVVISSSSAYGKGVSIGKTLAGNRSVHICYCHTPMRFVWDFRRYIANETGSIFLKKLACLTLPFMKRWDFRTSRSVDLFVANSSAVRKRIREHYDRDSSLIFPPVEIPMAYGSAITGDFFLVVSRLVAYKRIDLAVDACTIANLPLVIIGDGPDRKRLESVAGPSVIFLGFQSNEVKRNYMAACRAFIFPGEEDFGITPLEVNGLGRPVVAYRAGGALDYIRDGVNGLFFENQSTRELLDALNRVGEIEWDTVLISNLAKQFDKKVFIERLKNLVEVAYNEPIAHDQKILDFVGKQRGSSL